MRKFPVRIIVLGASLMMGACATRPLPKYEKPIARAQFQTIRTTAYTDSESDHRKYSNHSALGSNLQSGSINSAAADWSRWPAGTIFRIQETGELFCVDDYGWALSGTNTIDLYKATRTAMNGWGVRRVNIEVIEWGNVDRSLAILKGRSKFKHVRRMLNEIGDRYAELKRPVPAAMPSPSVAAASSTGGVRLSPFVTGTGR